MSFSEIMSSSLEDTVKGLLGDAIKYKQDTTAIWDELEAVTDEGDRSFYKNFEKISSSASILDKFKAKAASIDITFNRWKEVDLTKSQETNSKTKRENDKMGTIAKILRGLQTLVMDHSVALQLLKELFILQGEKLDGVKSNFDNGLGDTAYVDNEIAKRFDAKAKELSDKMTTLQEELQEVKQENARLRKENSKLSIDNDETRQRGMKGNLKIYAPQATQEILPNRGGRRETLTEMCTRLVQKKTGCDILQSDVSACHRLKDNDHTYILAVANRLPGSGWESLTAGMVNGRMKNSQEYFKKDGVFLSYQVTQAKAKLLHQIRLARKQGHISKFSVNENGRVTVRRAKTTPIATGQTKPKETWETVDSLQRFQEMFPGLTHPLTSENGRDRVPNSQQ